MMAVVNSLEDNLAFMFFIEEERKDLIMLLPTPQGWEVLNALRLSVPLQTTAEGLHNVLRKIAKRRWKALRISVQGKLCEFPSEPTDFDPEAEEEFYSQKFLTLEKLKAQHADSQSSRWNPGKAWRQNETGTFVNRGDHALYPGGQFGNPVPVPKKKPGQKKKGPETKGAPHLGSTL